MKKTHSCPPTIWTSLKENNEQDIFNVAWPTQIEIEDTLQKAEKWCAWEGAWEILLNTDGLSQACLQYEVVCSDTGYPEQEADKWMEFGTTKNQGD